MRTRSLLLRQHRVVGLVVGLFLLVLGLTGAILALGGGDDGEPIKPTDGVAVSAVALVNSINLASATLPGARVARIALPSAAGEPLELSVVEPDFSSTTVLSDVETGEIIDIRAPNFLDFVHDLHATFLLDRLALRETGRYLTGAIGLLGIALVTLGVCLWHIKHRRSGGRFRIYVGGNWKRSVWDIHGVAGIFAAAPLLVLFATGAVIALKGVGPSDLDSFLDRFGKPEARAMARLARPQAPLYIDPLLKGAEAALPGGRITEIQLPLRVGDPVRVRKKFPGDPFRLGQSFVTLDATSAVVLHVSDARNPSFGGAFADKWIKAIHSGRAAGVAGQIILAAAGVVPTLLLLTGTIVWLNRRHTWRHIAQAAHGLFRWPAARRAGPTRAIEERLAAIEAVLQQLLEAQREPDHRARALALVAERLREPEPRSADGEQSDREATELERHRRS
jgi:uncharacterized iron-regulated membrane protein